MLAVRIHVYQCLFLRCDVRIDTLLNIIYHRSRGADFKIHAYGFKKQINIPSTKLLRNKDGLMTNCSLPCGRKHLAKSGYTREKLFDIILAMFTNKRN